jgi:hypothetical protein
MTHPSLPLLRVPVAEILQEAGVLMALLHQYGLTVRAMGGVAVALRCPSSACTMLRRCYVDIDLVTNRQTARVLDEAMRAAGYTTEDEFNALYSIRRLLYWDNANGRQVDVFVETVHLCHTLRLIDRLDIHPITLSLADLLMLKLQIVETNEKDLLDAATLLLDHPIAADETGINGSYIARLCAKDWGLWKTTMNTLEKLETYIAKLELTQYTKILRRIQVLRAAIDEVPRTWRWRIRARIGTRVRWYELPEEVRR